MPFTTKYNYLVFFLRLSTVVFFLFLLVAFTIYTLENRENSVKNILSRIAGFLSITLLLYYWGRTLLIQRKTITIVNNGIKVKDILTLQAKSYSKAEVKGFKIDKYKTKLWDFKSLIISFQDGQTIELPQFLYLNFKEIEQALSNNNYKRRS